MVQTRWLLGVVVVLIGWSQGNQGAIADPNRPAQTGAAASPAALCPAQLEDAIAPIIQRPAFERSRWGILVQRLSPNPASRTTLYAYDAQHYFIPASNTKLLTTAVALRRLGPSFRIRTSVYGQPDATELASLRVVGRGDPSFNTQQLTALAQQLRQRGIRTVQRLVGNDHYFQGAAVHPTWEWEDVQAGYGTAVNSLILNENAIGLTLVPQALGQPLGVKWDDPTEGRRWQIENESKTVALDAPEFVDVGRDFNRPILKVRGQLRVGADSEPVAVSIPEPGRYFLDRFRQSLAMAMVPVKEIGLSPAAIAAQEVELATVESPPISQLVTETNQQSNNVYAEALLRTLGVTQTPSSQDATADGIAVIKTTLTALGVSPTSYVMADGSGLSRRNLISPEALVQTLQAMAQVPEADIYRASLPSAGKNGTLSNRFRGTLAEGRLFAKTGTLTGVTSLSGYLSPPHHPPLAISILVNNSDQPTFTLRTAVDEIVLVLTRLQSCE